MNPVMQDAAAQALRDGLVRFDGGRGWSDLGMSDRHVAAIGPGSSTARRSAPAIPTGRRPSSCRRAAARRLSASPTARPAAACVRRLDADARRRRSGFRRAEARHGDHRQADGAGELALRSVPEVSGGMLVEEVHTGRVLAMQGGFDVLGSSYNRADPGAPAAGLGVQADRLCHRARERLDAGDDRSSTRHSASTRAPGLATNASSTSTAARPARTRCAGAWSSRAT